MNKIFLSGGWGYGNLGDNAILAGTLKCITEADPSIALHIESFDIDELRALHGLPSVPSLHKQISDAVANDQTIQTRLKAWLATDNAVAIDEMPDFLKSTFNEMRNSGAVIFAGGGYFNDTWVEAFPIRLAEFRMAVLCGRPCYILAQTIGPFSLQNASGPLVKILPKFTAITYRDKQSAQTLESAGVPSDILSYTADLAHLVGKHSDETDSPHGQNTIGLMLQNFRRHENVTGYSERGSIRSRLGYVTVLLRSLNIVSRRLNSPKFVVFSSTTWDKKFLRIFCRLARLIGVDANYVDVTGRPVEEFIRACQSVKVMVSTNMHPIILATVANIPVVALSYHFKLDDYMDRIGRSSSCLRIDSFTASQLADSIAEACNRGSSAASKSEELSQAVILDAAKNIKVLRESLSRFA